MGTEVFENLVNHHADRSRAKRMRKARMILGWMALLTILSMLALVCYWTGINQSGFNLTVGCLCAVGCAFCAGRIAEMRM